VRDPRNLSFLRNVLHKTDTTKQEIVVMTAASITENTASAGAPALTPAKSSIITSRIVHQRGRFGGARGKPVPCWLSRRAMCLTPL